MGRLRTAQQPELMRIKPRYTLMRAVTHCSPFPLRTPNPRVFVLSRARARHSEKTGNEETMSFAGASPRTPRRA
jgi:hypothetical protein